MWVGLAAGGLLVLAIGIGAARYFARWTLRPVAELDAAVNHIGAGNYQVRVPDHLGPPELRRLANAFNHMTVTVADLLDRQRRFVSDASHQLRNPLTALRLHVEDLGTGGTPPAAGDAGSRSGHQLAIEEIARFGQVLDSLLAMVRADSVHPPAELVDAGACAAARVATWEPLASRNGICLRYRPPGEPALAYAVATALDQVLDTLIDNAVKFCGPGRSVTVMVLAAESGAAGPARNPDGTGEQGVTVHVIDDGPGLTADQRERAFERFWRGPATYGVDGSGLGLPIAAVLVEASGGRLDLLPVVPKGLDARVWLPISPPPEG
jgi:signal transduction histidine kinase